MNIAALTTDQLADLWMDRREIQNLMGKYVYYKLLKDETKLVDDFWSSRDDICLGVNQGYYVGQEAVRGYYDAVDANTAVRTKHMKELYPLYFKDKSLEEMHGVGSVEVDALTTCVIEQADDGETAKGVWYVVGEDINLWPQGPLAHWGYGYIAADFIREGDDWKVWHLQDVVDIDTPTGTSWADGRIEPEVLPEFAALGEKLLPMPAPSVASVIREAFYPGRKFTPLVRIPEPYSTFSETFSYGI